MSSATHSNPPPAISPDEVAERVRSLQLDQSERKTAEFGMRGLRWVLLLGLVAGGVWWLSGQDGRVLPETWKQWVPARKQRWDVVPVKTEGGDVVLLDLTGYITPRQKVNLSARIPGTLVDMNFQEGELVEQGTVLARLDDSSYRADFDQASAALAAVESRLQELQNGALPEELDQARTAVEQGRDKLKLAERELARMQTLKNDLPASDWDKIESAVLDARSNLKTLEQKLKLMESGPRAERIRGAQADVDQARALVAKAQTALKNTVITAPIAGMVLERHGEVGEQIRPDALGTGLFVLADLSHLEVQVDVEEQSLGKLKVGQLCKIIPDAYSDRTYAATISRWQPQVNRARAVVRVILTITEPDELLLAEMNCRAVILDTSRPTDEETLWIPAAAVLTTEGLSQVLVAEKGTARVRTVQLGLTKEDLVQVINGVSKSESVVLPGKTPPADGQKLP